MITPSFGLTATERVLPKLALDFTTASLDSRITFTRTTGASNPATYVNNSGVITAATNNQPRFDYDPVTLACKGLLIEESRQNKYTYSNTLDNVIWVPSAVTVTTASLATPDGGSTSYVLVPIAGNYSFRELQQNTSVISGTTYCISGYYKQKEHRYVQIIGSSAPFGTFYVNFDLQTGTETAFSAGTSTVVSRGITSAGNGWYRVWAAVTALSTTSSRLAVDIIANSTDVRGAAFVANGTDGLYAFGAQFEQGSFPTSYIPTTTTALTRNADVATMTGTNFSDWFNASQGAFIYQIIKNGSAIIDISATDGTTSNTLGFESAANNDTEGFIKTAGVTQANPYSAAGSLTLNAVNKIGLLYANNYVYGAKNGVALTTANPDTSATIPTVDQLQIGKLGTNNRQGFYLQKLLYYPQRITNSELLAFTK